MVTLLRDNMQFLIFMIIWLLAGAFAGPLVFGVVSLSVLLLARREYLTEVFVGFWIVLIWSDSRISSIVFTGQLKVVYILLLVVVMFIRRKELAEVPKTLFRLFIPFFVWILIMVLDSPDMFESIKKTLSYILLFFIVPVFVGYMMRKDHRHFMRTLVFFVGIYLTIGLLLKYISPEPVFLAGRYMGLMGNPNGLGVLVALFAILFDNFNRRDSETFTKREKFVFYSLLLLSLFFCRSRSAFFMLVIYFAFSRLRLLGGFLGVLTFISLLFSYAYISENLESIVQSLGLQEFLRVDSLDSASGRFIAWNFAWENIQDQFFVGRGYNYTEFLFGKNYQMLSRMGHLGNAHNSFLTFWLDTGLIGLVLFLIPFVLLFVRAAKVSNASVPAMYAILFSAMFESWLIGSLNPFTICMLTILTVMESPLADSEELTAGAEENEPTVLAEAVYES